MIYVKTSYTNLGRQIYAVGVRRNQNDTLLILAEFHDIDAPYYVACNEADKFLASLESRT